MADLNAQEAELSGFVDRGTQIVLREAIRQIIENFGQTETLEDILNYLEELRTDSQNKEERIKDIQQKTKQAQEKISALETSIRNLLQRVQNMEVQVSMFAEKISNLELLNKLEVLDLLDGKLDLLVHFFAQSPIARMVSKLSLENTNEHIEVNENIDKIIEPMYQEETIEELEEME